jgi:hypothetical protein
MQQWGLGGWQQVRGRGEEARRQEGGKRKERGREREEEGGRRKGKEKGEGEKGCQCGLPSSSLLPAEVFYSFPPFLSLLYLLERVRKEEGGRRKEEGGGRREEGGGRRKEGELQFLIFLERAYLASAITKQFHFPLTPCRIC